MACDLIYSGRVGVAEWQEQKRPDTWPFLNVSLNST